MTRPRLLIAGWITIGIANGVAAEPASKPPTDLPKLAETLDLRGNGIWRWLDRLGVSRDGSQTERLLAADLTGKILMERHGDGSGVRVDSELDDLLLRADMAIVLIHNHPESVGLSLADLRHLHKPGVAAMIAIGHDGSVFVAAAGPRFDRFDFADRHYPTVMAEIRTQLRREWPSGRLSVAAGDAHTSHLVTLALARANVVRYWFKFRGGSLLSYEGSRYAFNRIAALGATVLIR